MMTIYKYEIDKVAEQLVKTFEYANFIHAGFDPGGKLCVWVEVCPTNPVAHIPIYIIGTGHPLPNDVRFISTVNDGPFIWHIYTNA